MSFLQAVESTIVLIDENGQPKNINFDGRPFWKSIYELPWSRLLIVGGRQVEKTTFAANYLHVTSTFLRNRRSLYVNPTYLQMKTFYADYIKGFVDNAPLLNVISPDDRDQSTFRRSYRTRSVIFFRHVFLSADRARGLSNIHALLIDEFQDVVMDLVPVIEECTSHVANPVYFYTGTHKSTDNPINVYFNKFSTACEWLVPCFRHSFVEWNILGDKNVGPEGLVCSKCGKTIYADHPDAHWRAMNPTPEGHDFYYGFRFNQLMVPWYQTKSKWNTILDKRTRYKPEQWYNEVLGMPYMQGSRPFDLEHLKTLCDPLIRMGDIKKWRRLAAGGHLFAGVDHGTGENTYTFLTLLAYIHGKLTVLYMKRFEGQEADPEFTMNFICNLARELSVSIMGVDYGGGFDRNRRLQKEFGVQKVAVYQYTELKEKIKWEPRLLRWEANRSPVMRDIIDAVNSGKIVFPHVDDMMKYNFFGEFTSIFLERAITKRGIERVVYHKEHGRTDDGFHSLLYGVLASILLHPRPDIIVPEVYDAVA